ncbi:MAG: hypothetical protein AAFN92_07740, partial [Bacteroidota bacterium]
MTRLFFQPRPQGRYLPGLAPAVLARTILPLLLLFALPTLLVAQSLTGAVKDPEGCPLIGGHLLIRGTSSGTVTAVDG